MSGFILLEKISDICNFHRNYAHRTYIHYHKYNFHHIDDFHHTCNHLRKCNSDFYILDYYIPFLHSYKKTSIRYLN